jgi:hypothetical protein
VDESAEEVTAAQAVRRVQRRWVAAVRWEEVERTVRPVLVVVAAVDTEHMLEVAAAGDEDPVETISAESEHPALGEGVRVRRLHRRADHPDAFGSKTSSKA